MQTNGVLLDDGWIDLFERYRISAGVSLDGPPVVNNLHRLDLKGNSSYDRTVEGLRLLQQAAAQRRVSEPGLLSVINPFANGVPTWSPFCARSGRNAMSFLTPDYTWDSVVGESLIRGVERFLLASLRAWLADKNPKIQIRVFSELLSAMPTPQAMEVVHTYWTTFRNIISVSSQW